MDEKGFQQKPFPATPKSTGRRNVGVYIGENIQILMMDVRGRYRWTPGRVVNVRENRVRLKPAACYSGRGLGAGFAEQPWMCHDCPLWRKGPQETSRQQRRRLRKEREGEMHAWQLAKEAAEARREPPPPHPDRSLLTRAAERFFGEPLGADFVWADVARMAAEYDLPPWYVRHSIQAEVNSLLQRKRRYFISLKASESVPGLPPALVTTGRPRYCLTLSPGQQQAFDAWQARVRQRQSGDGGNAGPRFGQQCPRISEVRLDDLASMSMAELYGFESYQWEDVDDDADDDDTLEGSHSAMESPRGSPECSVLPSESLLSAHNVSPLSKWNGDDEGSDDDDDPLTLDEYHLNMAIFGGSNKIPRRVGGPGAATPTVCVSDDGRISSAWHPHDGQKGTELDRDEGLSSGAQDAGKGKVVPPVGAGRPSWDALLWETMDGLQASATSPTPIDTTPLQPVVPDERLHAPWSWGDEDDKGVGVVSDEPSRPVSSPFRAVQHVEVDLVAGQVAHVECLRTGCNRVCVGPTLLRLDSQQERLCLVEWGTV